MQKFCKFENLKPTFLFYTFNFTKTSTSVDVLCTFLLKFYFSSLFIIISHLPHLTHITFFSEYTPFSSSCPYLYLRLSFFSFIFFFFWESFSFLFFFYNLGFILLL